jgi:16S rRNA G527 N7-methylase RsmG
MENMPIILSGITENLQLSIIDMSGKKISYLLKACHKWPD